MEHFPDVLRAAATAEGLSPDQRALIEAPELRAFWQRLAAHVPALVARGWSSVDAAAVLVGAVVTPLALGHDAHGSVAWRVRRGIDMARRQKAARDARALAEALRAIEAEPLPPDVVVSIGDALGWPDDVAERIPTILWCTRPAEVLERLADGLEAEPDLSEAPGLASRKPGWRGFIREVVANLSDYGFAIREVDMVRLAGTLCRAAGVMPPSRDAVRDALREWQPEPRTLA